jgi:hypothetical protein
MISLGVRGRISPSCEAIRGGLGSAGRIVRPSTWPMAGRTS